MTGHTPLRRSDPANHITCLHLPADLHQRRYVAENKDLPFCDRLLRHEEERAPQKIITDGNNTTSAGGGHQAVGHILVPTIPIFITVKINPLMGNSASGRGWSPPRHHITEGHTRLKKPTTEITSITLIDTAHKKAELLHS